MKIIIPGGSGQVGTILARAFHRDGHHVVVLSKVALRSAMTLSPDAGGVFDTLLGLVRRGLGGPRSASRTAA